MTWRFFSACAGGRTPARRISSRRTAPGPVPSACPFVPRITRAACGRSRKGCPTPALPAKTAACRHRTVSERTMRDQRVAREAVVGKHIGNHVQTVLADGVCTERRFRGTSLEIPAQQANLNHTRSLSTKLSRLTDVLHTSAARAVISSKTGSGSGVEYAVLPQQLQTRVLVERDGWLHAAFLLGRL